ncbi:MAG TPA: helix-turn-helix domain-containing protein [Thermoleophilaceae bacterium]|nr:helix-turn-helix domain-containing protein [Thermoleophilaceae bacterium]
MSAERAAAERLPRGRHKLSRAQVVESQRHRLLQAMADALAEKGYTNTSVADVLARAGVSRETFYQQFPSKEECFLETLDHASRILLERVSASAGGQGAAAGVDRILGGYLETLASEPAYARVYLVEVYAVGPRAVRHRVAAQEMFAAALAEQLGATTDDQRMACEVLVAAVSSMVTNRVALGEAESLPELREPLAQFVRSVARSAFGAEL